MISVIVPVFNEEESILHFYDELMHHLPKLSETLPAARLPAGQGRQGYEIIFVDDGSVDNTLNLAKELAKKDKNIKIYSFRRNHGKAEALTFGFQKAKGDLILTMDADLQDKPSEIKKLFDRQKKGFDLVSGWRKNRRDSLAKIIFSKFFNLVAYMSWGIKLHDYNCGLKLYTKDAAKSVNLYGGMHRFIPLLVAEQGFAVTEVPVTHDARKYGKSKYNAIKIFTQSPDMMTMIFLSKYGKRPLHLFGFIGAILFGLGLLISIYLSILRFQGETIGNRPLLLLGILLIISGIQIGLTGLIADLVLNVSRKNSSLEIMLKYSSDS